MLHLTTEYTYMQQKLYIQTYLILFWLNISKGANEIEL
jgi:hypothetical protein